MFLAPLAVAAVALSGSATVSFPSSVTVSPTGKTQRAQGDYRLPVARGLAGGGVRLAGGLRLARGGREVGLTSLEVDGKRVTARVDGVLRRKVFTLRKPKVQTLAGTTTIVAGLLGTPALTLGKDAVRGRIDLKATADQLQLVGGRTDLTLAQEFRDALAAELITPGGGEGAPTSDGAFGFPVSSGQLNSRRLEGTVNHGGGLTLSKANQPLVRLEDYLLDTRSNLIAGRINDADRVDLFAVGLPAPALNGDTVTFTDATAALTATAATALNEAFDTTVFSEGMPVGTFTVSAQVD